MRALFLDTCAILKYFLPEKGSEVVRWLCSRKAILCGVRCTSSPRVKQEFFDVVDRKCQSGQISQDQADQIRITASDLFKRLIHVRGDTPLPGLSSKDITADELVERHKLTIGKNNWDMDHIETIVNHLRFLTDTSKIQVVTADRGFGEILEREGYVIINPEAKKLDDLLAEWSTANGGLRYQ